jgi:hypothetical protein
MTPEEEIAILKAKLKARDGKQGYEANVREIKARLAELEREGGE